MDDLASVQPWRVRCIEVRGVAEALTTPNGPLIGLYPQRMISFGIDEPVIEAHRLEDQQVETSTKLGASAADHSPRSELP